MKTKYLYVKNGKVELSVTELEEMLKEKYNDGYEAARILYSTSCSSTAINYTCPYRYSSGCPYFYSVTSAVTDNTISNTLTGITCNDNSKLQDYNSKLDITYCNDGCITGKVSAHVTSMSEDTVFASTEG